MLVQPACSAASFTALRIALLEKVAPETPSTPVPFAARISAMTGSKATLPTWSVSLFAPTSIAVTALSEKVTATSTGPL